MKTNNQMKPLAKFIAASLAVGSMAGFGAQALAQTAAGTLIKNLATVTYEDENGNSYSAQSNEAVVTVAPVYSATIENDNTLSGAPGQTVYFPHIVSNTGNIEDTYTVATDSGALIYLDENGNGQPDPGETTVTSITIPAGEQVSLVVAVPVPTTAVNGATIDTKLTATSANLTAAASSVTDLTDAAGGSDAAQGTNDDTLTVSTGPVLVLNKSSVIDEATDTITYTLTVKNTGATDATNVDITDPLPKVDTNGDGTLDTQLSFVSVSVNGLLGANGDTVPTTVGSVDESSVGDLNGDGVTEILNAIVAQDATLPPNTTVSIVYTASYDTDNNTATPITWAAGSAIDNTFIASSTEITTPVPSNTTNDVLPQVYGVIADDTNLNVGAGINDGGDDDGGSVIDTQTVDAVAAGSEVLFQHVITNNGNGDDIFNLDVVNTDFPSGTVFTYWDSTGTVQLTDSDNDGVPDTGILASGDAETIMIKAKLPAGVSDVTTGGGAYDAVLTATSSSDPSATPQSDDTNLTLGSIVEASVDIIVTGAPQGTAGFNVLDGLVNAQDEGPVALENAMVGSTVTFPLELANESGSPDSFLLEANNVPAGWTVVFKDASGNVITTTPLVPGQGTFAYTAEVTVSSVVSEALSVSDQAGAIDGIDSVDDGVVSTAGDTDLDYQMNFKATSTSTTTLSDSVTTSVDVDPIREVVITPNGQNQVQPGGTVEYSHDLENNGNQSESVELDLTNTQTGWTTVINVDTTGDGIPDSILNPLAVTSIWGVDEDGTLVAIPVADLDGDGQPELVIPPGVDIPMTSTVSAPSDAPLGSVDLSTISVTETSNGPTPGTLLDSAEDQTTVMLGQVRLDKKAAIDTDCDTVPDGAGATFTATQLTEVEPGQCVVWQLTAVNEGTATVKNVKISDAAPAFTDFLTGAGGSVFPGAIKFCQGNGCAPAAVTEIADSDGGMYSAGLVNFYSIGGSTADPANQIGGELIAGEQMTGQFTVKVQ